MSRAHLQPLLMLRCPCSDFADCVRFARLQFQDWFNVAIKNLLHQHPLDEEADGVPYWSQKKRPPTPEEFSLEDELHASFIVSSACLYARLFSIPESSVRSSRPPCACVSMAVTVVSCGANRTLRTTPLP